MNLIGAVIALPLVVSRSWPPRLTMILWLIYGAGLAMVAIAEVASNRRRWGQLILGLGTLIASTLVGALRFGITESASWLAPVCGTEFLLAMTLVSKCDPVGLLGIFQGDRDEVPSEARRAASVGVILFVALALPTGIAEVLRQ